MIKLKVAKSIDNLKMTRIGQHNANDFNRKHKAKNETQQN
jgi:hypothetical protein